LKCLCLIFFHEKKLDALSKKESDVLVDESLAYDDVLRQSGHFIAAQALQPVHAVTTVRLRSGKVAVTDGPFAETNEQIGGFILIDARGLNEAIQLASRIPSLRLGGRQSAANQGIDQQQPQPMSSVAGGLRCVPHAYHLWHWQLLAHRRAP